MSCQNWWERCGPTPSPVIFSTSELSKTTQLLKRHGRVEYRVARMSKLTEIHGVVFDMDGVLIDSHPAHRESWREVLHLLHKEISETPLDFILARRTHEENLLHFLCNLSVAVKLALWKPEDVLYRI